MNKLISQLVSLNNFKLRVQGVSMLPLLHPNDILYFNKIIFKKIQINDIVLSHKNSTRFVHRVIFKNDNYCITKGDNNLRADGKLYRKNIFLKIDKVKRDGRIIQLENLYLLQSTIYYREIVKVKYTLKKEKINYVFLKGLPLHLYYDKQHPQRIYADSDILIEKKNLAKVLDIFKRLSYQTLEKKTGFLQTIFHFHPTQTSFVKIIDKIPVIFDIHYDSVFMFAKTGKIEALDPDHLIDDFTASLLANKQAISIYNQKFPILSAAYLVIFLSLHFFQHNFRGIFRLDLIQKIIMHHQGKKLWDKIFDIIKEYNLENFVFPAMLYLMKYYHIIIPKHFLISITPDKQKLSYFRSMMRKTNIFDDDTSGKVGIARFKNLFYLSPLPLYKKLGVIFDLSLLLIGFEKIYQITIKKFKHIW